MTPRENMIRAIEFRRPERLPVSGYGDQSDGVGVFFAGSGNATQVNVQTLANQWLQEAWTAWAAGADGMHLAAAYGNNFQDVVLIIPLPAPVLMAGLGLLAIPVLRRKFC